MLSNYKKAVRTINFHDIYTSTKPLFSKLRIMKLPIYKTVSYTVLVLNVLNYSSPRSITTKYLATNLNLTLFITCSVFLLLLFFFPYFYLSVYFSLSYTSLYFISPHELNKLNKNQLIIRWSIQVSLYC